MTNRYRYRNKVTGNLEIEPSPLNGGILADVSHFRAALG